LQSADTDERSASSVTPLDGLVREPDGVFIVNPASGETQRYPLPANLGKHQIAAALLPDGNLLLIATRNYQDRDTHVVWLKPSGEIARQQTVHRQVQWRQPSLAALGWAWAAEAPLPLVSAAATFGWMPEMVPNNLDNEDEEISYSRALGIVLWRTWPSILAVFAAACFSAALAYRRHKRFGLPNSIEWAAFAFVFGIPGWIAHRFHCVWPVLEECPACHQPSPRDRDACLDCGKAFPAPPLKGIEVFA
jgi:hypothetical protein